MGPINRYSQWRAEEEGRRGGGGGNLIRDQGAERGAGATQQEINSLIDSLLQE